MTARRDYVDCPMQPGCKWGQVSIINKVEDGVAAVLALTHVNY
jgi:hypothetical protein